MKSIRFIVFVCLFSHLTYAPLDAASKAKRGVQTTPIPSPPLDSLYDHSYALIIGISTAILPQTQENGVAIPINTVKTILSKIRMKGKVTRGWLGVAVQAMTPELANSLKLAQGSGVLVSQVLNGSPADTAGLRTGDLVVEVKGKKIKDGHQLVLLIASLPVG